MTTDCSATQAVPLSNDFDVTTIIGGLGDVRHAAVDVDGHVPGADGDVGLPAE